MTLAPREKSITAGIVAWLRAHGHFVVKLHGGPYGTGGLPDLLCLVRVPGDPRAAALFVEVKRPGNRPTLRQAATLERLRAAGAWTLVATSIDDVRTAVGHGVAL